MSRHRTAALVGNPNAGKSALFNMLTGARQKIANYPGVTVERKAGRLVVFSDGSINAAASDMRRADMTDPDQQRRSKGGDSGFSGPADSSS